MDEIWIELDGARVYGRTAGSGPLVLGLHGWSQRNGWHTWEPLIRPLAQAGFRVVSVDMPGWGKSPQLGSGRLTSESAVAVVLDLLDGLGVDQASLMGKSWGGGIALQAALAYPSRVGKLILTAPAFRDFERLRDLESPVLMAWSEDDDVIPIRYAQVYVERVPTLSLVTYETGGHSAAPKNAADFAPKAVEFLKSLEAK